MARRIKQLVPWEQQDLAQLLTTLQRGAEGATASCAMWKVEGEPRPLGEMPAWTKPSDRKRGLEAKHSKGD